MNKTVIFDFDGTIAETIPLSLQAIKNAYKKSGIEPPSIGTMVSHFGANEFGMLRQMSGDKAEKVFANYIQEYARLHAEYAPKPFDGIVEAIKSIKNKGYKIGLVTGKHQLTAKISLEFYGMEKLFDAVRCGGLSGTIKTANIANLLQIWDIDGAHAWYLGDVIQDIIDARAAGVHPLTARWAKSEVSQIEQLKRKNPEALFTSIVDFRKWIDTF